MITTTTAYGVALTDEFGKLYRKFRDFGYIKPNKYESDDDFEINHFTLDSFCATCYSVEEQQLVLGFPVTVTKTMDIPAIHNQWLEHMENLPSEMKQIIEEIKKEHPDAFEPDFQFMAGDC